MKPTFHASRITHHTSLLLLLLCLLPACRQPAPPAGQSSSEKLIIGITQDGPYRLSLSQLQDAGLALETLSADTLALSSSGLPIPYTLTDDALIFYGQAPNSRYITERPYTLTTNQPGQLIPQTAVPATTTTTTLQHIQQSRHLEQNHVYDTQALTTTTDPWFWQKIGRGETVQIPFDLSTVPSQPAELRLHLWGVTESAEIANDHDFDLLLNDTRLTTVQWDGQTAYTATVTLPPDLLQPGVNTLTLDNSVPGASRLDIMQLNSLDLAFTTPPTATDDRLHFTPPASGSLTLTGFSAPPLVLDVQDPTHPTHLTGETQGNDLTLALDDSMVVTAVGPQGYLTPTTIRPARLSAWADSQNQADLLIITTDELAPELAPLVEKRTSEGLSVAVVPVAEIYDAFGHGAASPESIQAFVQYTAANWQSPAPQYLLLVGDATTDYHNNLGSNPTNHVPALLVPVEFSGETVSDGRLADIDGDTVADLAVGRWPADNPTQVADLVRRTLAYESGAADATALFATDATEGQFADLAQRLWQNSSLTDSVNHLNGAQADAVTAAWNDGAWLTTYIGHGSLALWGKDNIFSIEAVSGLNNSQPPIVLQLTCLTGLFAQPGIESLSETMLHAKNGPVLLVAATSLTLSNHQEPFANALLQNLTNSDYTRIGDAFQNAKTSLDPKSNGLREISDTFVLIGDPTAHIVRPPATP
jgi:hypothetical protein